MLKHWLGAELGREANIFYDVENIEAGQDWPEELAEALAASRVMIALWSREYFTSSWCQAELAQMLARVESLREGGRRAHLILAAIIHDGDAIPHELMRTQYVEIRQYANPWMTQNSEKARELAEILKQFAVHVGHAITKAPSFDPEWRTLAIERFTQTFEDHPTDQLTVPSLRWTKS